MDYVSVAINIEPFSQEWADILMAELSDIEYESFQVEAPVLNCFIQADRFVEAHLKLVLEAYGNCECPSFSFTKKFIAETNWNALWEAQFRPVNIPVGKGCSIRSNKSGSKDNNLTQAAYRLVLDPDMAFGTGNHPTTWLMIRELLLMEQNHLIKGSKVMDFGCGTGILAIVAAKMGAQLPVHAVDISPRAKTSCLDNARRNRIPHKINAIVGDASYIQANRYNLLLANINRNLLVDEMTVFFNGLTPGGHLLLSGFFTQDVPIIKEAALKCGFTCTKKASHQGWALLHFTK